MLILDSHDRVILSALQRDGRMSITSLASHVHLSESACLRRVRRLEDSGIIERYAAHLNQRLAGYPVTVFVEITLDRQSEPDLQSFEKAVQSIPEVLECYIMSGRSDYLLRVVVPDMPDYERLHARELTRLPGVAKVHSSFALRTILKARELPIAGTR